MKRIITLLIATVLVLFSCGSVAAYQYTYEYFPDPSDRYCRYVSDEADLLTDEEEHQLDVKMHEIYKSTNANLYILVKSNYSFSAQSTAENYLEERVEIGGHGSVFAYFDSDREAYIDTVGGCQLVVGLSEQDEIFDAVTYAIKAGRFYEAFMTYATMCEQYLTDYILANGALYFEEEAETDFSFEPYQVILVSAGVALLIGLVVGVITASVMKSKLKSVRYKFVADDYLVDDSVRITKSRDLFLYRTVIRTARPKNNNSGGFGGGRGHTGSGRKF